MPIRHSYRLRYSLQWGQNILLVESQYESSAWHNGQWKILRRELNSGVVRSLPQKGQVIASFLLISSPQEGHFLIRKKALKGKGTGYFMEL